MTPNTPAASAQIRQRAVEFFDLLQRKDRTSLATVLHPQVVFSPRIVEGTLYQGRDEVLAIFYDEVFSWPLYEPEAVAIEPISDCFVVVQGRVRYMKNRGGLADVPVTWLLGFEESQLTHLYGTGAREDALEQFASLDADREHDSPRSAATPRAP